MPEESSVTFEVLFFLVGFFPPLALICDDKNTAELCSINCIPVCLLNSSEMGIFLAVEVAATLPAERHGPVAIRKGGARDTLAGK